MVQVGRVDRDLVKNLLLGYVTADNNKKLGRLLRTILSTVFCCEADTGVAGEGGATRVLALPNPLGTPLSPPQLKKDEQKRNITEVFSFFLYDSDEGNSVRSTPPRRPVATLFENFLATPVGADLFFWPGSEVEV